MLLAVALSLQQIASVDYWWLLRTGKLIAETGSVPRYDIFSYTASGAAWIDIHWLFQLVGFRCCGVRPPAALMTHLESVTAAPLEAGSLEESLEEKLRALGYLE